MPCPKAKPLYDRPRRRRYGVLKRIPKFVARRILDPQKMPPPIDIHGYDHTIIRLVPEIDNLVEAQIVLPARAFEEVKEALKGSKDVEFDEANNRIVRRGRDNKATNIFIDKE